MPRYTVLFDACVLYPAPLRDLLMHLAVADLFHAKWTDAIHDEWIENLLANRPDLKREQLQRTRELMNAHVRDCLVSGHEPLIDSLTLPDPDDRHVLAAAIHGRVDAIVTTNLKDFPAEALSKFALEAIHPDDFLVHQLTLSAPTVCLAAKRQRTALRNPPKNASEYLDTLRACGLLQTVSMLEEYRELI